MKTNQKTNEYGGGTYRKYPPLLKRTVVVRRFNQIGKTRLATDEQEIRLAAGTARNTVSIGIGIWHNGHAGAHDVGRGQ